MSRDRMDKVLNNVGGLPVASNLQGIFPEVGFTCSVAASMPGCLELSGDHHQPAYLLSCRYGGRLETVSTLKSETPLL